jgi:putative ABC transport system ATP-binding protein
VSAQPGIRIDMLTKHYATSAGAVRAVDGVTLGIESGSSLAVTGPSGCGKSTLLGLIAGLETPSAGSVSIGEHAISRLPERERASIRRSEVGLVFQADNLLPFLTAIENVAWQLALRGGAGGFERCAGLLAQLGVADCSGKLPDQLSGGQRQRVAIARALIHQPQTILADEPTGSLDVASAKAVIDLLQDAQQRLGATLIVVTHDAALADRLERRLDLRDGRVVGDRRRRTLSEGSRADA